MGDGPTGGPLLTQDNSNIKANYVMLQDAFEPTISVFERFKTRVSETTQPFDWPCGTIDSRTYVPSYILYQVYILLLTW
jgi:hypothetical protein